MRQRRHPSIAAMDGGMKPYRYPQRNECDHQCDTQLHGLIICSYFPFTTQDCSYWIPPPPTAAPTPCPAVDSQNVTCPEPPSCPTCNGTGPWRSSSSAPSQGNGSGTMVAGGVGTLVGVLIGVILGKFYFRGGRKGYTEIPSVEDGSAP